MADIFVPPKDAPLSSDKEAKRLIGLRKKAGELRLNWESIWQDIYDYAIPHREQFFEQQVGQSRTDMIFDETAVVGTPRFASRTLAGLFPDNGRAFMLVPGPEIPDEAKGPRLQAQLDAVTDAIHESTWNSNFVSEAHEAFIDLAVGTGNLSVDAGDRPGDLVFVAAPLTQMYLLPGPNDQPRTWIRERKMPSDEIKTVWPQARLPKKILDEIAKDQPQKYTILEVVERIYDESRTEKYKWSLVAQECEDVLAQRTVEGLGSIPWITFRWSKSAIEVYGRGPLMQALPAIKTLNVAIEMILQNSQIAMGGIWTYDDDGVFSVDNVSLEPGTFIPRMPGSRIDELVPSGRFDLTQLVLDDMRRNVRKALFIDELEREAKTPLSATEVAERLADVSRDMGAISGRLKSELLFPYVRRVVHILTKQGLLEMPRVDGRQIKIVPQSPLLRAQKQQDINDFLRYQESLQFSYQEAAPAMTKMVEAAQYLAELHGIPGRLIPTREELQENLANAAALQQQAATAIPQ